MPDKVPRPDTLVQRTIDTLRFQFSSGRYMEALPGEPRLASQLSVARGTLRKALQALEEEGLITSRATGKPRRVLPSPPSTKTKKTQSVGVLIPRRLDELAAATQHFLRDLAAITAADGITFIPHHSTACHREHPARLLKSLLAEHQADLWLIYEASIPVARFFRASGVPAIICGGPAVDEGLSFCGFDGRPALRHAIGTFIRAGHTRIVSPTRFPRPVREQIFRQEFEKRGLPFDLQTNMPCWNSDLDQLHDLLCSRLKAANRPTAWIINGLEGLLVTFSTLLELKLQIPADISLLTIGSDPMLGCFRPAISHYSTPHRSLAVAMARMIRKHLKSPPTKPEIHLLQTEFVEGGSVCPAP